MLPDLEAQVKSLENRFSTVTEHNALFEKYAQDFAELENKFSMLETSVKAPRITVPEKKVAQTKKAV